jgi:hypothetical protein
VSRAEPGFDPAAAAALAEVLRVQAGHCERLGSPLYAGLLTRAATDIEASGPTWQLLRGHEHDEDGSVLGLRLMGAVHRLVLEGRLPELADAYRRPDADAGAAWEPFSQALTEHTSELAPLLERTVQTNEVGRSAVLLPGFLTVAARTGLPLVVLEVGSSAGLNLRWDRYRYEAEGFSWGPADSPLRLGFELSGPPPPAPALTVAERRGCDPSPLDPTGEEGRLTLLSYLWPDQSHRVERMEAAAAIAAEAPARVDRAGAAAWTRERLAEPADGLATVVFHSIVMQYLEEPERREFESALREAGERATETSPLAWLRMEPAGDRAEVRLTLWPGGEASLLARASYHGDSVELLAA